MLQMPVLAALLLSGCAGPLTPIGAVGGFTHEPISGDKALLFAEARTRRSARDWVANDSTPRITITPSRQILHGRTLVRVTIDDPIGDLEAYQVFVRYNGN